jgi:hypothetical protein
MKLKNLEERLDKVCRTVEIGLRDIQELQRIELDIILKSDLSGFPEAESQFIKNSPAIYVLAHQTIYINEATFFQFSTLEHRSIIVHEIGHAYRHLNEIPKEEMSDMPMLFYHSECVLADLLTCKWGFIEGLISERAKSYGDSYVE